MRQLRSQTRQRGISKALIAYILGRDDFTCRMCGAAPGEPHPDDPSWKLQLHVGRIVHKSIGGTDEPGNLRAICSDCNEGVKNLILERPSRQELLIQVRRATGTDQVAVLEWLARRYPEQAARLVETALDRS
jgi:HNH endonuclease